MSAERPVEVLDDAFPKRILHQYAWKEAIVALLVSGQAAQANAPLDQIRHEPTETGFQIGAALELARAGRMKRALTIAEELPDPEQRSLVVRASTLWPARATQTDDTIALVERLVPGFQQTAIIAEVVLVLAHRHGINAAHDHGQPIFERVQAQPTSFWHS
ncbi:MAG: hypothetical protein OHK0022_07310 [Roseiflexaceae bacterium]